MRWLAITVSGTIGFLLAAVVALTVALCATTPTSPPAAPPVASTPDPVPTPAATPARTPAATPTPRSTPRPTPTPPPIARCLTVDGRSLDLERQFVSKTMAGLADQGLPTLVSIADVSAINIRHESGTTYHHTAQYTIVARSALAGAEPIRASWVVSGVINAANCAAALR